MQPLNTLFPPFTGCSTNLFNNGIHLGFNSTTHVCLGDSRSLLLDNSCQWLNLLHSRVITPSIFSHPLSLASAKYFTYAMSSKGQWFCLISYFQFSYPIVPISLTKETLTHMIVFSHIILHNSDP